MTATSALRAVCTWLRSLLVLQQGCYWAHLGLRRWRVLSRSARLSNRTRLLLSKFWDGSWCKSKSRYSLSSFVSSLLDYWTHRNLLSRPERYCISAHFIGYTASCGAMALPVKLCRATERKCCGLEAPSEGAMGPWSLYPARHETYMKSHMPRPLLYYVSPYYVSSECRGRLALVTINPSPPSADHTPITPLLSVPGSKAVISTKSQNHTTK